MRELSSWLLPARKCIHCKQTTTTKIGTHCIHVGSAMRALRRAQNNGQSDQDDNLFGQNFSVWRSFLSGRVHDFQINNKVLCRIECRGHCLWKIANISDTFSDQNFFTL